jgi:hypothetical protein
MRRRLYIPEEVKESIIKHFTASLRKAVEGFYSAYEDEDSMTGHLGGLLRIRNQRVSVTQSELSGEWEWSIDYFKFRGRGTNATERLLGADGLFELKLNYNNRIETKSLLFQSKLIWQRDPLLLSQSIKLSTWREAAFVLNYTPDSFQAFLLDDVIRAKGIFNDRLNKIPLDKFLGDFFLNCDVGDTDLTYDARSRKLIWRTRNGEIVGTKFSIPKRFRIKINAPQIGGKQRKVDREIPNDEIHNFRMDASDEEILSFTRPFPGKKTKSTYKDLALTYHPDRYNTLDDLERIIMQRRMQEVNDSYYSLKNKKR